jgi:hypothetical protein
LTDLQATKKMRGPSLTLWIRLSIILILIFPPSLTLSILAQGKKGKTPSTSREDRDSGKPDRRAKKASLAPRPSPKSLAPLRKASEEKVSRETLPQSELSRRGKFGKANEETKTEAARPAPPAPRVELAREPATSPASVPAAAPWPDRIEVYEHGSARWAEMQRSLNPPRMRAMTAGTSQFNISTRKIDVAINPLRAAEIQRALAAKGFYAGEPTGIWDEATVEAMRGFQLKERIDVTGYPTAYALKRLGLTDF